MDKDTRSAIERATQRGRRLLEDDFASQLEGTFDVLRTGQVSPTAGAHLTARQGYQRDKIVAAIEHKLAAGMNAADAVADYLRDAAFTTLNRFVALKLLEARELVQECITKGEQSAGYIEFCGMASGVALLPDSAGYRFYIESLFDELSIEVKVLFDRRDLASVLWPKRATFEALLNVLNAADLSGVWSEDETIGWVYQFFNSGEERKRMRDESQAPRNSRELAVRNQFFTPRYVVEFLVDNTLGRTWLQMHGADSRLKERCRYFVESEEEQPRARPRKDPRDLRILDPACGSGHFLLYCFDLLLTIYEEAWSVESSDVLSQATGKTLRSEYETLERLRHEAPKLILQHNLYGVDIDPRAAQIAALALWLRAQRAWKDIGTAASKRPPVRHTHIVVAEPIPGDSALIDEFAARLDPPLLRDLFRRMVGEMRLAGDLGALIPVEEGIAAALHRAREQFLTQRQLTGFLPGMAPIRERGDLDLSGIDDDHFFHDAESQIVDALRGFAEAATDGANAGRRLFAGDAAQGIALIDLLRTRFDIVLMNPPFGAGSLRAKKEFEKAYPRTKNDIYAAFVERGIGLLHRNGFLGAITSRTGLFLPSFQKWREDILLRESVPVVVADLGLGVMDAALVEAAAYCAEKAPDRNMKTIFIRILEEAHDKREALLGAIGQPKDAFGRRYFAVDSTKFAAISRSPFAYWVSDDLRSLFTKLPLFESADRTAKVGVQTSDDFRFVRAWWAVDASKINSTWLLFAKGGAFSPFYSDVYLTINWQGGGRQVSNFALPGSDRIASRPQNVEYFFRPGLTWSHRTKSDLSFRVLPAGCAFGHKGPGAFVRGDNPIELLALLAVFRSKAYRSLVDLQLAAAEPTGRGGAARSYDVGVLQRTPVPRLMPPDCAILARLAHQSWLLRRSHDTSIETSHAFVLPSLLQIAGADVNARAASWSEKVRSVDAKLICIQAEIDERCLDLYGIGEVDRRAIVEGFSDHNSETATNKHSDHAKDDVEEEPDENEPATDESAVAADFVSWAVGVAFGRFDVRMGTGTLSIPTVPEPFDPLAISSPSMLVGNDGLPLARPPSGYGLTFPETGLLVDDLGQTGDVVAAVRAVFDAVFDADADHWWKNVAELLDARRHDLRAWLGDSFFDHHIKRYSKSRRKAPIYWQLGTPSGRYSLWLYAHRLTRDSFFQVQNEIVGPKLSHEERQLTGLIQNAGGSPSSSQRKEIATQEALVEELRGMLEEIKRIAPLWNPNLDDGVVLTMAPLWRLVPQHKAWQRELKSKWDELVAGKYDWAHVAMHLWPERVIPKCTEDRSLAIAHGLEDMFWVEGTDGKWTPRTTPLRPIEDLVRERSSPAVKAALSSLLNAPSSSQTGRNKKRSGTATTAS